MSKTQDRQSEVAELRAKRNAKRTEAAAAKAAAHQMVKDEKAKGYDPLATDSANREVFERINAAFTAADTIGEEAAELSRRLELELDQHGAAAVDAADGDPTHPALAAALDMGAIVVASDSYREFKASGQLEMAEGGPVRFDPVTVLDKDAAKRFLASGVILADAGDGTPLVPTDERLAPVMIPRRMVTLLDLITMGTTGRDAVTWVRQTLRTNAAATKAYGTAFDPSRYTFERVTAPAIRKGHYVVVDEGNIADSDEFQTTVNGELVEDLRYKVEVDALTGAGGSDWTGIYNASGIGSIDRTALTLTKSDALHRLITTVRVALEREPTGFGIDPTDYEEFALEKGGDDHYLHHRGGIEGIGNTVWGLPAMISTAYTKPIVGAWRQGATMWVREGIAVAVDRINAQFIEGLWTIRAQTRAAFAVKQPKAFAVCENY